MESAGFLKKQMIMFPVSLTLSSMLTLVSVVTLAVGSIAGAEDKPCPLGLSAFQQTIYPLVRTHCVKCHGGNGPGPGHSGSDAAQSYQAILKYVDFQDLENSRWIQAGGNKHCLDFQVDCAVDVPLLSQISRSWWEKGQKTCKSRFPFMLPAKPLPARGGFVKLRWDLGVLGKAFSGLLFEIEAERFAMAYRLRWPKIVDQSGTRGLHVQGVHLILNDSVTPAQTGFDSIDFTTSNSILSSSEPIVLGGKSGADRLAIGFDKLVLTPFVQCQAPTYFKDRVMPYLGALRCFKCHVQPPSPELTCAQMAPLIRGSDGTGEGEQHSLLMNILKGAAGHPLIAPKPTEAAPLLKAWLEREQNSEDYKLIPKFIDEHKFWPFGSLSWKELFHGGTPLRARQLSVANWGGCAIMENGRLKCFAAERLRSFVRFNPDVTRFYKKDEYSFQMSGPLRGDDLPYMDFGINPATEKPFLVKSVAVSDSLGCVILENGWNRCWEIEIIDKTAYDDGIRRARDGEEAETQNAQQNKNVLFSSFKPIQGFKVTEFFLGDYSSCALYENGRASCPEKLNVRNYYSEVQSDGFLNLGINPETGKPFKVLKMAVSESLRCALLENHRLKCFGENAFGQAGYPISDLDMPQGDLGGNLRPIVARFRPKGKPRFVSKGDIRKKIEELYDVKLPPKKYVSGRVIYVTALDSADPGSFVDLGANPSTHAPWKVLDVGVGSYFACAVLENHQVKCWGSNPFGTLGLGDDEPRNSETDKMGDRLEFVDLGDGLPVESLSCMRTPGGTEIGKGCCAKLGPMHQVKCWGPGVLVLEEEERKAFLGQRKTDMGRNLPYLKGFGMYQSVYDFSFGPYYGCGLLNSGFVRCLGDRSIPQESDSGSSSKSTPPPISPDSDVEFVLENLGTK